MQDDAAPSRVEQLKSSLRSCFTLEYVVKTVLLFLYFMCFSVDLCMVSSLMFASPVMLTDHTTLGNFNKETYGIMNSVSTASFFVGKLLIPLFIDRIGGAWINLGVTFGISIFTFLFGYIAWLVYYTDLPRTNNGVPVQAILITVWCINRFLDSASWSGLTVIVRTWFPPQVWGTIFGVMSTFSRIARVFIGLALTALLFDWRLLFMVSGIYGLGVFAVTFVAYSSGSCLLGKQLQSNESSSADQESEYASVNQKKEEEEEGTGLLKPNAAPKKEEHPLDNKNDLYAILYILVSPSFWIMSIVQCTYYGIFELPSYLPAYLNEAKGLSVEDAGRASLAFSLGPAVTIFLAGLIYDVLQKWRFGRLIFIAILQVIVALCAAALWAIPNLNVGFTMVLLFLLSAAASPGFYIAFSIYSAKFGGAKHTAKVNSFVSAIASLFDIGFVYAMGAVSEKVGWNVFWLMMLIVCIVSAVFACLHEIRDIGISIVDSIKQYIAKKRVKPQTLD